MKTPEQIVSMIGNIGNRPDIRKVQEEQALLIKEYAKIWAAEELERIAMKVPLIVVSPDLAKYLRYRAKELRSELQD